MMDGRAGLGLGFGFLRVGGRFIAWSYRNCCLNTLTLTCNGYRHEGKVRVAEHLRRTGHA